MKKLLAPGGPLGVFTEYPLLARFAAICICAEVAWAILIAVLQFHFTEDLFAHASEQLVASRIATITLAFVGCETIFKIPMGSLADRIGPRRVIFFALGVAAVSPLLMTRATVWYQFIPLRALDGLGAAALWPSMSALMARSVPRAAKAAAMSVFNGAYCLGLAVGPIAGLTIGHRFGYTSVFPLCAVLLLLGLFIAWTVLRGGLGDVAKAVQTSGSSTAGEASHADDASEFLADKTILKGRPMLWRMMFLYALSQAAIGLFGNCMVPYINGEFGIHGKDLPRLIALPALCVAVLALPLGRMADTIGRAKAVWISYVMATVGMFLVASTSWMRPNDAMISGPLVVFSLGLLLMAASYILGTPAWLGLTSLQVDDAHQAKTLSLMQTAQGVGVVVGSAMVAYAGHLMGSLGRWGGKHLKVPIGKLRHGMGHMNPHFHLHVPRILRAHDTIPITVWLWSACALFALCLVGTVLWIHEPPHDPEAELEARSNRQPIEITGV